MYVTVAGFTTAAINAAKTTAGFGGTIFLPPGTYSITSTIDLTEINVIGVGIKTILRGVSASLGATNPMFKLAKICTVQNLYAEFDVKPTTATTGQYVIFQCGNPSVEFGELQRYSYFNGILTGQCGTAFYNPVGIAVFSSTFSNLRVENFRYRGFDFLSDNRTGNVYSNIYLTGGGYSTVVNCLFALAGNESECSIIQLNVEHCTFSAAAIIFNGCNALSVTSLHFEALYPLSNNIPFVYTNSSSGVFDAFTFLGNYYNVTRPNNGIPTTTGNSLFQCNNSLNNYANFGGNAYTANYFQFGVFYAANVDGADGLSWYMFARGANDGPMYISLGNYQYAPNNAWYRSFPTNGNLTFINTGVNSNYNKPLTTVPGNLLVSNSINNVLSGATYGDLQYCNVQITQGGQNTVGGAAAVIQSSNDDSCSLIGFYKTRSTTASGLAALQNNVKPDDLGELSYHGTDGSKYIKGCFITAAIDGAVSTNNLPTKLVIGTLSSGGYPFPGEGIRIDSNQNFWAAKKSVFGFNNNFGQTQSSYLPTFLPISINDPFVANRTWAIGPSGGNFFITQNSGSYAGVQLTWGSTSWTTPSDETKKDIIEPIDDALIKLNDVRAVIGKFKTDEPGTRRPFLIAQDFENVFPEAVDPTLMGDEEVLGLRYTDVIPLLVAAIKELSTKVEELESKL
jgi:hypothetical protein